MASLEEMMAGLDPVVKRPGMWGPESPKGFDCFIEGYVRGLQSMGGPDLLEDFRQWVPKKFRQSGVLGWPGAVRKACGGISGEGSDFLNFYALRFMELLRECQGERDQPVKPSRKRKKKAE